MGLNDGFVELKHFLDGISKEAKTKQREIIEQNAKLLAQNIQNDSPVRKVGYSYSSKGKKLPRGTYKKGWKSSKMFDDGSTVIYRIENKGKHKTLVPLLEFGHGKGANGKGCIAEAIPHVLNNRNKIEEKILNETEKMLNELGSK